MHGEIIFDTLNEGDFIGEKSCLCGTPSLTSFSIYRDMNFPALSRGSDN